MQAAARDTIYTETIATRVSPDVLAAVQEAAKAAGVKPGVWLRMAIGNVLKGDAGQRILLAEVMALRTVLLTLQKATWRAGDFTDERLEALVKAAEARKFAQADARILAGKSE